MIELFLLFFQFSQTPFKTLELIFVTHFSFDYIVGYIYAKNKVKYFFHYLSLIDLITIIPVFAMYAAVNQTKQKKELK